MFKAENNKNILNIIPDLFETNLQNDKDGMSLFNKLSNIFRYDEGYIYFISPDTIELKYSFPVKKDNNISNLPYKFKQELFSKEGKIANKEDEFINYLGLNDALNTFLISKISIKSTVFGFVLLCSKKENFYDENDMINLNTAAAIISYILKDLELSSVFKMQLKALKDGIIEKNNAYKTIKEQNEKILEADKIKNEFLANISHELRTPLNSILGFADILSEGLYGELNYKQKDYVNDIKVSGTHLLGMINEILDMSKIEAHAMKIVKSIFLISRAINEVSNILYPLAQKKNIKLVKNIDEDFEIFADYQKIQQILYNLISNAIKYSPNDDKVEITVSKTDESFKISIHDNGIGIDKKYHGKIFAKFVQLDSAYTKKESSTGLGLTITKELVELHEGKVSVISEVNNGSTFVVEIPF